jgi:glutaredoxin
VRAATIEVFYSPTCPNCPPQKRVAKQVEDDTVAVELIDVTKHAERAKEHSIKSVPTTIIHGPAIDHNIGFRGLTTQERLEQAIGVAKGELKVDALANPTLLDKIKQMIS